MTSRDFNAEFAAMGFDARVKAHLRGGPASVSYRSDLRADMAR